MSVKLTTKEEDIHRQALKASREYKCAEWKLIQVLQKVDSEKLFKKLGFPSLFQYSVKALSLSEAVTYSLITVARKSLVVPELAFSIETQALSASKASKIVSAMNAENATELIEFARTHSTREVEFEVARINPTASSREKVRALSEDVVELRLSISRDVYDKLMRARDLISKNSSQPSAEALGVLAEDYIERHDPVCKAERATARRAKRQSGLENSSREETLPRAHQADSTPPPTQLFTRRVEPAEPSSIIGRNSGQQKRVPLTAEERHDVIARDGAQCTFVDETGSRCTHRKWLHIHHIRHVSRGGGNDASNLTMLCSFHHELVHQLSFALEGQISWVKELAVAYVS